MAKPIITAEDMEDPRLRAVVNKYGDDFRRLSREDRQLVMRNVARIPLWALLVFDPMERKTKGYDEAYVRQQQSRDNDMARLDILAKHKRQLMELEKAGMVGTSQHKMAIAQALRSLTMLDVSRNTSLTATQVAKLENKTAYHLQMTLDGARKQAAIVTMEEKAANTARALVAQTSALTDPIALTPQVVADMNQLAGDAKAQEAYIVQMQALKPGLNVMETVKRAAYDKETNKGAYEDYVAADTATLAQGLETAAKEKEAARKQVKTHTDSMGKISAGFGFDGTTMDTIKAELTRLWNTEPESDASKSKSVGTIVGDMVEKEYTTQRDAQADADAERTPTYWAEIEALISNSPEFLDAYKLKGEPYGKTKLEFFKELMKADKTLDKEERRRGEEEAGLTKGIERAERVAAGDALNSSAVERLVARMRVGLSKVGRYITGDESGRSEKLDEDLLDLPPAPEAEEPEEVAPEDLPSDARTGDSDHNVNLDLLAANPTDARPVTDNDAAEIVGGANADKESAQSANPKTPKTKEEKAEDAKKPTGAK